MFILKNFSKNAGRKFCCNDFEIKQLDCKSYTTMYKDKHNNAVIKNTRTKSQMIKWCKQSTQQKLIKL